MWSAQSRQEMDGLISPALGQEAIKQDERRALLTLLPHSQQNVAAGNLGI